MYSPFSIQTRLPPLEAERALERLVRPKRSFFSPNPATPDLRPFVGKVEGSTFKFHRIFHGKNSFVPIVVGRVTQGDGGAVIRGHMRLVIPVAVVMTVWTIAPLVALPGAVADHKLMAACALVFLPVFGALLVGVGYLPEKRKAMRLLADAFPPAAAVPSDRRPSAV